MPANDTQIVITSRELKSITIDESRGKMTITWNKDPHVTSRKVNSIELGIEVLNKNIKHE